MNKRDEDTELRCIIKPLRDTPPLGLDRAPERLIRAIEELRAIPLARLADRVCDTERSVTRG